MTTKHAWLLLIISTVCLLTIEPLVAQSLTFDNNSYRANDSIVKKRVAYKDAGSKGRALNWDFGTLQEEDEAYPVHYFIPDSSKLNIVCGKEHRTRYYFKQHNDSLWALGYENATTLMKYTKPELRMRFPFTYGDTLRSSFVGIGEYCHRLPLQVAGNILIVADAEGKLILPDIVIEKALRVHTSRHYTETGRDSLTMNVDTYSWYAPKSRYPVFESVRTQETKNERDTVLFTTSFYYPPIAQQLQTEEEIIVDSLANADPETATDVFTEAQFTPNPVRSNLLLTYKLTRPAKVWFTVHSGGGIPLCQTYPEYLTEGYHTTTVPMSSLVTGTYTLYVHVDDMILTETLIKL